MTPKDIFFSYKREEKERILPIVRALEAHDWTVWWDTKILPGDTFRKTITKALKDSHCVVVAWSELSVESDWVCDEAVQGKRKNKLVPILIDDVDIPLGFGEYQAANLVHWNGNLKDEEFQKLIAKISAIVGGQEAVPKNEPTPAKLVTSTPLGVKPAQLKTPSLKAWVQPVSSKAEKLPGVIVDPGALNAILNGADLYPVGILDVLGSFGVLARINLYDSNSNLVADGITEYASSEVRKIKGKKSNQISQILGIHRSDAVVRSNSVSRKYQKSVSWKKDNSGSWNKQRIVTSSVPTRFGVGIVVDNGAIQAMRAGSNLLPIGVLNVTGRFPVGATIDIYDTNQQLVAQGVTEYSSHEISKIMGKQSSAISSILGKCRGEMIVENRFIFWK